MVLIIRNNRIFTSRQTRIKRFLSYVNKNRQKSNEKETFHEQSKEIPVMNLVTVLGTLFLYSLAMFTLPFVAFFGVEHIMKAEFNTDRFVTNCISVLAAVITVNLIIASYIYQAFHEPDNTSEINEITDQPCKENLNKKVD